MLLARKKIGSFLSRLIERVGSRELAGEPRWLKANLLGGLKTLPLKAPPA